MTDLVNGGLEEWLNLPQGRETHHARPLIQPMDASVLTGLNPES
jgi:hypothetical protein